VQGLHEIKLVVGEEARIVRLYRAYFATKIKFRSGTISVSPVAGRQTGEHGVQNEIKTVSVHTPTTIERGSGASLTPFRESVHVRGGIEV
jgi:hypothetical protein